MKISVQFFVCFIWCAVFWCTAVVRLFIGVSLYWQELVWTSDDLQFTQRPHVCCKYDIYSRDTKLTRLSTYSFIGFLKYFLYYFCSLKSLVPGVSSYFRTVPEPLWTSVWLIPLTLCFPDSDVVEHHSQMIFALHQDATLPLCISDATRKTCSRGDSSYNYSYCI